MWFDLNPGNSGETLGRAVADNEQPCRRKRRKKISEKIKREIEELHEYNPALWESHDNQGKPTQACDHEA
jgi:hypothetical protein